jgi:hypothetical protein
VCACALVWICRGIYIHHRDDLKFVNFLAAWIPFVLSLLVAFVPESKMSTAKKIGWRTVVIAVGFVWSVVLWQQQLLAENSATADQERIVTTAVTRSNEHSDQQIGGVRSDVQGVKTDMQGVKKDLETKINDTISKSTSSLSESIGKVKLPPSEKASYEASLWPATLTDWPIREKSLPKVNGVVTLSFSFRVKNHMAKQTRLWLRLCRGCKYAKEPLGFQNLSPHPGEGDDPNERTLIIGDFLPNIAYTPISVDVIPPADQTVFLVGVLVGCENCDPINPDSPQVV